MVAAITKETMISLVSEIKQVLARRCTIHQPPKQLIGMRIFRLVDERHLFTTSLGPNKSS